jgi:hypothetical protein
MSIRRGSQVFQRITDFPYDFSSMLAVKPMPRRFDGVGFISSRIAERMAVMASSCSPSFLSIRASSWANGRASSGDGAFAAEDRGEHGYALLGEGVRWVAATAATGF